MAIEPQVIVAGHICLDLMPQFAVSGSAALTPGSLVHVGAALRSTGGAVSNTGLALHRLGVGVKLMGKIGDDLFGHEILRILNDQGPVLAQGMCVVQGEVTSYSVVISPPGVDRMFLHCPGANDTFSADDLDWSAIESGGAGSGGARMLHFGYPPIMREMYIDGGQQLQSIMVRARRAGLVTSLDMCSVDPASQAGRVDWPELLERVLPEVDIFAPSIDELRVMLRQGGGANHALEHGHGEYGKAVTGAELGEISERLLAMGAAIVVLKLGDQGLYVRTTTDEARLEHLAARLPISKARWLNAQALAPCFAAHFVSANGAGDTTIAGFLAAMLRGEAPAMALRSATAVGACSVEAADAVSGVRPWPEIQQRLARGWKQMPSTLAL